MKNLGALQCKFSVRSVHFLPDNTSPIFTVKITTDSAYAQRRYPCNTSEFRRQCHSSLFRQVTPFWSSVKFFALNFESRVAEAAALHYGRSRGI